MIHPALFERIRLAALTRTDLRLTGDEAQSIELALKEQSDIDHAAQCAEAAPDGERIETYDRVRRSQGAR